LRTTLRQYALPPATRAVPGQHSRSDRWKPRDLDANGIGIAMESLRVVVEVQATKHDGGLTLPVVAATVDLEGARATSRLSVRGCREMTVVRCSQRGRLWQGSTDGEHPQVRQPCPRLC